MKKRIPISTLSLVAALLFSTSLMAQETTEVTVKVTKDGKVVKDTTYVYDDDTKAKHAVKMMEVMSGDEKNMMKYNYTVTSEGDKGVDKMIFISEDGEKTEIKEIHGDSMVWISEEDADGKHVNVFKKKMIDGEDPHGEHVVVMKKGDGETFDIFIDKEEYKEGKKGEKKMVKVMVSGDEDGTWHVDGKELKHVDEDVYIIKGGDDVKVELKEILEDHDGENVKVIVVKTDIDENHDIHEHIDIHEHHDHDVDVDHDEDKEVEVEVEKKVKKKSKKQ